MRAFELNNTQVALTVDTLRVYAPTLLFKKNVVQMILDFVPKRTRFRAQDWRYTKTLCFCEECQRKTPAPKPAVCNLCQAGFPSRNRLHSHLRIVHINTVD